MSDTPGAVIAPAATKRSRWKRRVKWTVFLTLAVLGVLALLLRDYVRTLQSLRRVAGTNAYVMDYYCDYHPEEIRKRGIDVSRIEDACIETLFPDLIVPIAQRVKQVYLPNDSGMVSSGAHHCSTLTVESDDGDVFFGRNFDWPHDACLILKVHDAKGLSSLAVIDLHYLNLNRPDLDKTTLIERIPLLFAPYYVMDGMNRHGVAISDMSVNPVEPPRDPQKPDIGSSTLMRVILDYAEDTEDAVELINSYNVHFAEAHVHFMIADATGNSKIVEFLGGEVRVTPCKGSWQVCTNSVAWNRSEPERDKDCPRYQSGSEILEAAQGHVDHNGAVRAARAMAVPGYTMWTSVYNLSAGEVRLLYKSRPEFEYRDAMPRPGSDQPSGAAEASNQTP